MSHLPLLSPAAEVQDGIGRQHAEDDEGPCDGNGDVIGGVGQQHVLVHTRAKCQEATDPWRGQKARGGYQPGLGEGWGTGTWMKEVARFVPGAHTLVGSMGHQRDSNLGSRCRIQSDDSISSAVVAVGEFTAVPVPGSLAQQFG